MPPTAWMRTCGFSTTVQEMPEYKGSTTLIFAADHGRGEGAEDWKGRGARLSDSKYVWMAFLGPDTPPLGERKPLALIQIQIAGATLARKAR